MLTPIVCFTCGTSIGDLAPIYHFIRRKRAALRYGEPGAEVASTHAANDPGRAENVMKDVLDGLRLTKCCRTHLVTAMLFSEHY